MHLLYNIAGLYRPAGMERVLSDKANWLAAHGHRVTILTTEQKGRPLAFPLDSRIEVRDLGIGYEENNNRGLLNKVLHYPWKQRRHRKALEKALAAYKPDITVSLFCNEVNLIPKMKDGSKKVLEVHFSRFKRLLYGRKGLWALADSIRNRQDGRLAGKYDRFVILTEEDKVNWKPMPNIEVIPNPIHYHPSEPARLDGKVVLAVGRYTYQKGLERLIEAWSLIRKDGWTLRLVGDGEDRPLLEKQVRDLHLEESVIMGWAEEDMADIYQNATILALPSRYEGLPLALMESQAFGIPAVSFDCPCGPREILRDGESGILVKEGDVEGLATALEQLMQQDALRKKMGAAAYENARRWDNEIIMNQWIRLFQEI